MAGFGHRISPPPGRRTSHAFRFPPAGGWSGRFGKSPHERRGGPLELEVDLWEEVRKLLPLLEACEELEPGEANDQNGEGCPRPV